VDHSSGDYTKHPSMKYDNTTVYLKGWHIHSPSEHVVQGERTKAEMHFVFGDAEGHEKAVAGIRIDPGNTASNFVSALPPMIGFANKTTVAWTMDLRKALDEVNNFSDFWTYKGSLTSPPCTEGIRWFVARNVMYISAKQMQALLGASSFSSRVKQDVWLHQINA
jgi:carbonic anhydrase